MSEVAGDAPASSNRAFWSVFFGGAGSALLGHLLVAALVPGVIWWLGGYSDVDLEAGGRFGINLVSLAVFVVAHLVLLAIVFLPVGSPRQPFIAGLLIGWTAGWLVNVVAALLCSAVWLPPVVQFLTCVPIRG